MSFRNLTVKRKTTKLERELAMVKSITPQVDLMMNDVVAPLRESNSNQKIGDLRDIKSISAMSIHSHIEVPE